MEDAVPEKKGGGGSPLWMATFADLMSLLLAFFVLLYSFSSTDEQLFSYVGGSLREAFGVENMGEKSEFLGVTHIQGAFSGGRPGMSLFSIALQAAAENMKRHLAVNQPDSGGIENKKEREERLLAALLMEFKKELLKETLGELLKKNSINIKLNPDNIIVTLEEKLLFKSGSDELQKKSYPVLDRIALLVNELEGTAEITGYTDNEPIRTRRFRSNWELSLRRAASVAELLSSTDKLSNSQVTAFGRGDSDPVASNDTASGRLKNRRVEIKISHENLLQKIAEEIKPLIKSKPKKSIVKKWKLPSFLENAPVINKLLFTRIER